MYNIVVLYIIHTTILLHNTTLCCDSSINAFRVLTYKNVDTAALHTQTHTPKRLTIILLYVTVAVIIITKRALYIYVLGRGPVARGSGNETTKTTRFESFSV